ncbi:MAG: hypothetical protein ACKVX7_11590 [Planctomycetota bacterium]
MLRALVTLNVLLVAIFGALLAVDRWFDTRDLAQRKAESTFHSLLDGETPRVAEIVRIDLTFPAVSESVRYQRQGEFWRLPAYRDGFGLAQELDGIVKSLLESRGTVAGQLPLHAEHFGFAAARTLIAEFYDGGDVRKLRAQLGRVAPGQRSDECYVAAEGRDRVLHFGANPWSYIPTELDPRFPPLLDVKVVPTALRRGLPARISFAGDGVEIRVITRREAPKDPSVGARPDQGPRYEWFGVLGGATGETELRVNDRAAFTYCQTLATLAFDELVGLHATHKELVAQATLVLTIEYDGKLEDTLRVAEATPSGRVALRHTATDLVCYVARDVAASLVPSRQALLEPNPAPSPAPK